MNSLDILIGLAACGIGFLFMVAGYAIGFREGKPEGIREGYIRGRELSRGSASYSYYTQPSDIRVIK